MEMSGMEFSPVISYTPQRCDKLLTESCHLDVAQSSENQRNQIDVGEVKVSQSYYRMIRGGLIFLVAIFVLIIMIHWGLFYYNVHQHNHLKEQVTEMHQTILNKIQNGEAKDQDQSNKAATLELIETITSTMRSRPVVKKQDPCGGNILVPDKMELEYVFTNDNDTDDDELEEHCVWVIWSRGLDNLTLTFKPNPQLFQSNSDHKNTKEMSQKSKSSISLHYLNRDIKTDTLLLPSEESLEPELWFTDLKLDAGFMIVKATSKRGQGFTLKVRCMNYCGRVSKYEPFVNIFSNSNSTQTFPYPIVRGSHYRNNERSLFSFEPFRRRKIEIVFKYVNFHPTDAKPGNDFVSMYKFSKAEQVFMLMEVYKGYVSDLSNSRFLGDENEPVLVFLYSDNKDGSHEFGLTYNYVSS